MNATESTGTKTTATSSKMARCLFLFLFLVAHCVHGHAEWPPSVARPNKRTPSFEHSCKEMASLTWKARGSVPHSCHFCFKISLQDPRSFSVRGGWSSCALLVDCVWGRWIPQKHAVLRVARAASLSLLLGTGELVESQ